MDQVLTGVAVAVITAIIFFVVGRFSVKTKTRIEVEALKKEMDCQKEAMPIIMECLLALLLATKGEKINGECDKALASLKAYLTKTKEN